MAFATNNEERGALLWRLRLWTDRLTRIRLDQTACCCQLAEMGIICALPPTVDTRDRPPVVRLKEQLLVMIREKERIRLEMARMAAEILDPQTLEVVLPGGPEPGSFLSWMPGEPVIAWWRLEKDPASSRRRLPGIDTTGGCPTTH